MMIGLLFVAATFAGGETPPSPPPVPVVVQASPAVPIHNGRPQEPAGETAADAVVVADDGYGFPVETGPAEIRRFGQPRDLSGLAEICGVKPWLCDDSYAAAESADGGVK